ncbi:MAG: metallophosphoesterase family protein [Candidatus Goldiibacteriota bacterium]
MRYAVISDIHSNIEAFEAVAAYLDKNPVDSIISCGDIVGYGPSPSECVKKALSIKNFRSVAGNHDAAAAGKIPADGFNADALASLEINKKLLGKDDLKYLSSLPEYISENDTLFVHGSPRKKLTEYLFLMEKFKSNISAFNESVCFIGHTHHPLIYQFNTLTGADTFINIEEDSEMYTLAEGKKYIINVGAVGQPRDGKASACLTFYDSKVKTFNFKRIPYDVPAVQAKMKKLGMPEALITRLSSGY